MNERQLYTIRWTQPYATESLRPYLRNLQEALERSIEVQISRNHCLEAKQLIERIKQL